MTDAENAKPDTALPKFSVNVTPVTQVRSEHLRAMLDRFKDGVAEPMILGRDGTPEAALIPFAAFVRLLRADHAQHAAAEAADHADLAGRLREIDESDDPGIELDALGEELGGSAQELIRRLRDDEQ